MRLLHRADLQASDLRRESCGRALQPGAVGVKF